MHITTVYILIYSHTEHPLDYIAMIWQLHVVASIDFFHAHCTYLSCHPEEVSKHII